MRRVAVIDVRLTDGKFDREPEPDPRIVHPLHLLVLDCLVNTAEYAATDNSDGHCKRYEGENGR